MNNEFDVFNTSSTKPDFFYTNSIIQNKQINHDEIVDDNIEYLTYTINSAYRDMSNYPNSNTFTIIFKNPIRNIMSVQLINFIANFDRRFIINSGNNTFSVSRLEEKTRTKKDEYGNIVYDTSGNIVIENYIDYDTKIITIPVGNYGLTSTTVINSGNQIKDLFDKMNILIQNEFPLVGNDLKFESKSPVDPTRDNTYYNKMTSTHTHAIVVNFHGNNSSSLGYLLGFLPNYDYYFAIGNVTPTEITAPYSSNFNKAQIAILNIDGFNINYASNEYSNNWSYAAFPVNKDDAKYRAGHPIIKKFKSPTGYIKQLDIKLTDIFGNPFDLQNEEIHFDLMFEVINQRN